MHKLGYLQVSSRIPKRNFHDSAQNSGVKQHSEQSRKPSSQQQDFKESWKAYMLTWVTDCQFHSSVSCWLRFFTWMIYHRYLYMKNCKAANIYHQVFWYPESVNTKQWFTMWTFCSVFVQDIVRVGYSPSLLLLWTLAICKLKSQKYVKQNIGNPMYYRELSSVNYV